MLAPVLSCCVISLASKGWLLSSGNTLLGATCLNTWSGPNEACGGGSAEIVIVFVLITPALYARREVNEYTT